MKFKKFVPTKTGKKIVANAIANRNDILFKRLAFGSGIWNDSDLENAITLKDERQSSLIDTLDIIDETTIRCVASISNKDLELEYDITEIGLFVEIDEKEILYSICCSDEKVTMFTQAEAGFYQIKIGCLQKISSTSESKIYVSNESFISKEMFIKWVEETEDNLNKTLDLQNEHLESMESLLENTPYTTVESEGEFELPVHTINDSETSAYSTWSSEKISEEMVGISKNLIVISGNSTASDERKSIIIDIPDSVDGVSRDDIISRYQIVLVTQTKEIEEGYLTQGPVFSVFEEIVYPSAFLNRNFFDPPLSYIRLYLDGTGFTGYIYYKIVLMKMQKKDPVAKPFDE